MLCHVITNSLAYYMYENFNPYLPENSFKGNSLSYSEDVNSRSESEAHIRTFGEAGNYNNRHKKKTHLRNRALHRETRDECSCNVCNTYYEYCKTFCDEMCSQNFVQYSLIRKTPKVIPLPYPVPVMILTQRAPEISRISSSTISTIASKEPTVKLKLYTTNTARKPIVESTKKTVRTTTKTTKMPKTTCDNFDISLENYPMSYEENILVRPELPILNKSAPKLLREAYDTYRLESSKPMIYKTHRPNLVKKMVSYEKRPVIPFRSSPYYRATKLPYKRPSLYRIVSIPKDLAEKLWRKN